MIRHIVMFKIKDEFKDEIPQLVKNFYGMKDQQDLVVTPNTGGVDSVDAATIEAKYAELPED